MFVQHLKYLLLQPDLRSNAEFLSDLRDKQAVKQLTDPAIVALLDRLEKGDLMARKNKNVDMRLECLAGAGG
ncbi:hypothetical protein EB74_24385 [Mycobacterium sp. SWH-M5]|nr:hypothetical protein EB74_24385 [Mycobacterium sp. SWH-M5]